MQTINLKALIETIRDCENNVQLIDTCFKGLPYEQKEAIKKVFPAQIGDGLISFIDEVIPAECYPDFEQHFNILYAAKTYPYWVDVFFQSEQTALRATVEKLGITPETVFTSENEMEKALDKLIANKISFKVDWLCQDDRYPDHQTGRLIIKHTTLKMTAAISQGGTVKNTEVTDYDFITDIDSLKNYDIQYLTIDQKGPVQDKTAQTTDPQTVAWILYGWYIENGNELEEDLLQSVVIARCSSQQKALNLLNLIEVLVSQWKGPNTIPYPLIP